MAYSYVLEEDEQRELLRIARTTVKEYLVSGRMPPGAPHKKSLIAPAAVFVTLHAGDTLRGCIGTTVESQPIYKAVQEMAVAAASRDPRFRAVRLDELNDLTFEVSVLSDRTPIQGPADIEIGKHGLQVTAGGGDRPHRGLLLPRVAVEQGWDAETFLARTCEKAGLPAAWWRGNESSFERFSAQVFDEKTLAVGPFAPV